MRTKWDGKNYIQPIATFINTTMKRVDWRDEVRVRNLITRIEALLRTTFDPNFDDQAQPQVSERLNAARSELKKIIAANENRLKQTA